MSYINKIIFNINLCAVLLSFSGQVLHAQQDMLQCREQARIIYSTFMKALAKPATDKGIHINYTMDVLDATGNHTEATFDVYMLPGQMRMIAKEVELYSDEKTVCTVLPLNREITIVPSSPVMTQDMMKKVALLQDTLFTLAVPVKCVDHPARDGETETEVLLSFKEKKVPGVELLGLFFNKQKSLLRKIVLYYPADSPYRQMSITYHTLDYTYQNSTMAATPVENIIFSAPNVLRPAYKDFTVYDTRKQPTRKSHETNR